MKKRYKKNYNFVITDNIGDINGFVLDEEVSLLLPYADGLLKTVLKKELTKKSKKSKVTVGTSAKRSGLFLCPKDNCAGG